MKGAGRAGLGHSSGVTPPLWHGHSLVPLCPFTQSWQLLWEAQVREAWLRWTLRRTPWRAVACRSCPCEPRGLHSGWGIRVLAHWGSPFPFPLPPTCKGGQELKLTQLCPEASRDLSGAWVLPAWNARWGSGHMRLATLGTGIGPLKCETSARGGGVRGGRLSSLLGGKQARSTSQSKEPLSMCLLTAMPSPELERAGLGLLLH